MDVPSEILELVERFERNRDAYHSGAYNETQIRLEFIDPFFKALGWDVHNEQGYAEAYKDVIHEDAIKVGGATKAPDYCFRIGGTRMFFVEAKKPSVNLKEDISPAFQLRRYAWSAKLPLSILTDFEEFAVYDCRVKPVKTDKASTARTLYLTYTDYEKRWDEIVSIFSREAVLKGSFDKYVESKKLKKGTAEVDDAFLEAIESWRELLARNIALRNSGLTRRELNYAVQRTIDRIVFLRICEDRGIEDYGKLMALLNGNNVYPRLFELFRKADERYNSGLFHFREEKDRPESPDELTAGLKVDDKTLKDIIRDIYYPESPYEFSVLPADILGHVYEQFLGKVIRLTAGHRAVVEDKPEVKKAGGVYYTPTFIVDYIVENTVGILLEGKNPKQATKLRILDPACGSGSFLLGAYKYLLDWQRDWYTENEPEKWAKGRNPKLYQGSGGDWRLTTGERKRILLNNIYGVDIDPQAVEVTKLSLLLKVLEGESDETLASQMKLFHERALPDLGENIKCGNSLVDSDYYENRQMGLTGIEERYRINPFDWVSEFSGILNDGGFDSIIGNPPYIRIQKMREWASEEIEYFKERYESANVGNYDIYVVFVERCLGLLKDSGVLGFILPHKFFNAHYGKPLRALLSRGRHMRQIVHFGDQQVFSSTTYTCLLFLRKSGNNSCMFEVVRNLKAWRTNGESEKQIVPTEQFSEREWTIVVGKGARLFEKLGNNYPSLGEVTSDIFVGLQTSADTVYLFKDYETNAKSEFVDVFSKSLKERLSPEQGILKQVIRSGNIGRYCANPTALLLFPYEVSDKSAQLLSPNKMQTDYPLAWSYLVSNKRKLEDREKGKFKDAQWYRFGRHQNIGMWEQPKLMVPYMVKRLSAYYDESEDYYFVNVTTGGFGITVDHEVCDPRYLCGLLNSRLLDFFFKHVSTTFRGGYYGANKQFIEKLPIHLVDFSNEKDEERHNHIIELVERLQELNNQISEVKVGNLEISMKREMEVIDKQIDKLVYELYGLTDDEIQIVENA
ncbi:Eco57I restriction-modification methylase domain-containing protein [Candidatus Parcubacteria bacterium]|nr:Eco57I restriction-modification methylase domain-containing protein [Candidatus Parcubacteria bacterium]